MRPVGRGGLRARGGYGPQRMVDLLDWDALRGAAPKVFVGYSDLTVLHEALAQQLGLATLHGPMAAAASFLEDGATREHLRPHALRARRSVREIDPGGAARTLVPGRARGVTLGGNLSLLAADRGTRHARPSAAGGILLLEDVGAAALQARPAADPTAALRLARRRRRHRARLLDGLRRTTRRSARCCGNGSAPLGVPVVEELWLRPRHLDPDSSAGRPRRAGRGRPYPHLRRTGAAVTAHRTPPSPPLPPGEPDPSVADPHVLLRGYLDYYRETLLRKIDGLSEGELRGSRVPSGWSPLELVRHLTYVERRWLCWGFEAEQIPDPWGDRGRGRELARPGRGTVAEISRRFPGTVRPLPRDRPGGPPGRPRQARRPLPHRGGGAVAGVDSLPPAAGVRPARRTARRGAGVGGRDDGGVTPTRR